MGARSRLLSGRAAARPGAARLVLISDRLRDVTIMSAEGGWAQAHEAAERVAQILVAAKATLAGHVFQRGVRLGQQLLGPRELDAEQLRLRRAAEHGFKFPLEEVVRNGES